MGRALCTKTLTTLRCKKARIFTAIEEKYLTLDQETEADSTRIKAKYGITMSHLNAERRRADD